MKKVIIDVDTGIDDALALILGIKSKKLDIHGVTTIAGNVPVELSTLNTLKVLKILGREDIEVYEGCEKPTKREIKFRNSFHGSDGIAGKLTKMKTKNKAKMHAVDFIIDQVNKNIEEITLIMLGPLTNLSTAIQKDPSIVEKIKEVYIMGGAVTVPGNITPVSEFNFYIDPESACDVMKHGLDIKLFSLDITRQASLTEEEISDIDTNSEYGKFVHDISKYYIDKSSLFAKDRSCILHDPLVVAAVINQELIKYENCYLDVEYSSRICDGKSVGYFNRGYKDNIKLARTIDKHKFKEMFLNNIKSTN